MFILIGYYWNIRSGKDIKLRNKTCPYPKKRSFWNEVTYILNRVASNNHFEPPVHSVSGNKSSIPYFSNLVQTVQYRAISPSQQNPFCVPGHGK